MEYGEIGIVDGLAWKICFISCLPENLVTFFLYCDNNYMYFNALLKTNKLFMYKLNSDFSKKYLQQ